MNPRLEDKVKDVREDMLSDKKFGSRLRVIISDSQIGVRTPHDSVASSMMKKTFSGNGSML